jgi:predicted DCC family thiol-disulfide oxidoreductase YuxK
MTNALILFDGTCMLCNAAVRLVIANDPRAFFRFAPLQSALAHELVGTTPGEGVLTETLILIEDGVRFERSAAVLRVLTRLRMPWPMFCVLAIVPRPVLDWLYRAIARNRYRWFGRRDQCIIPSPSLRARFME